MKKLFCYALLFLAVLTLNVAPSWAAIKVVSNVNDSGLGSFRQAILDANADPGPDSIVFTIAEQALTITLMTAPPPITDPVTIDGTTQLGYTGTPLIEITENDYDNGLKITASASGSTIKGLCFFNFHDAIELAGSSNNLIINNYIGLRANGSLGGNSGSGVYVNNASNNTIGGTTAATRNVITGNNNAGIFITAGANSANNNVVQGNFIGTNVAGTSSFGGHTQRGIFIGNTGAATASNNIIGGNTVGARNVISGNTGNGIEFGRVSFPGSGNFADNNIVQGNFIGTNAAGTEAVPNGGSGISFTPGASNNTIGGTTAGARNLISGNSLHGITFGGSGTSGNVVQGNYIGTNVNGTAALPNASNGIILQNGTTNNLLGGASAGAGNVISGNAQHGILIINPMTSGNMVQGNFIGTNAAGNGAVPNGVEGVLILAGASGNIIGGPAVGAGNVISGNSQFGVTISDPGSSGNLVQGNRIGTNATGTAALGNGFDGVMIQNGATDNFVGGTSAGAGNVISGNESGVLIVNNGTSGNRVQGNFIGTNAAGTAAIANVGRGIFIIDAPNNIIGGAEPGARNVVSGNQNIIGGGAIEISGALAAGNTVQGNFIGTDVNGTSDLGNDREGILISAGADGTIIGGSTAGAGNVISGNNENGIVIEGVGTSINTVRGNFIGINANGTGALPNSGRGVLIQSGAASNNIGGPGAGEGNVISGNGVHGVMIIDNGTTSNSVQGNSIGTNASGTGAIPNTSFGVSISSSASGNRIGGIQLGSGNTVAFNGSGGIFIASGVGNRINSNRMFANNGLGIDLFPAGITANDAGDADTGANNLQNFPIIATVTANGTVSGSLNSTPNSNFRIEFFANTSLDPSGAGEGEQFVGSVDVATEASGVATFDASFAPVPGKPFITATATNTSTGDTSEFSGGAPNNAPVNTVPGPQSATEDAPLFFAELNANAIRVTDVDAGNNPVRVILTVTNGSLTLGSTANLSFTIGNGVNDVTMNFSGTINNINTALDGLRYNPTPNFNGSATLTITTNDQGNTGAGGAKIDTDEIAITVTGVNDAPTNTVPGAQTLDEDSSLVFAKTTNNAIATADVDAADNLLQVTLTASTGTLTLDDSIGLSFSVGTGSEDKTMTFTGSIDNINVALDGLVYKSPLNYNGPATVTITTNDQGNTGLSGPLSDTDIVAVSVKAVNDAPTIIAPTDDFTLEDTDLIFSTAETNPITIADVDASDNPVQVTLSVAAGFLTLDQITGLSFSIGDGIADETMTFTGKIADINAALDGLTYSPDANADEFDVLEITVNDQGNTGSGGAKSATEEVIIDIFSVADGPIVLVPDAQSVNEDSSLVFSLANNNEFDVFDADAGNSNLRVVLAVSNGTLTLGSTTGLTFNAGNGIADPSMTFTAPVDAINAALEGLRFNPNPNYSGPANLFISVDDLSSPAIGGPLLDSDNVLITVVAVNDAPVNLVPGPQSVAQDTNLIFEGRSGNAVSITDIDAATSLVRVTLTATNGTITLKSTTGLTFSAGNGVSDAVSTFTGTTGSINAALNGLIFTPSANYTGSANLQITTNDLGNRGLGGPLSVSSNIPITVRSAPRSLTISNVSIVEGDSGTANAVFTVSLSSAGTAPVSVQFATADETAIAGSDYRVTPGILSFAPGTTTQTISVPIIGDTLNEDTETFLVRLTNPINANLAQAQGRATILDNDLVPTLSITDATVTEGTSGTSAATFTVNLSAPSGRSVTVAYTTADGTATVADNDYQASSGTLTFAPGETSKLVTVNVIGDTRVEADENFLVRLAEATNATIARNQGVGTITNSPLPVEPGSSVVTTTADVVANDGVTSLREAINFANTNPGTTIRFNLSRSRQNNVFILSPTSPLPTLTANGTVLDGNSQTSATGDTNPAGPEITIDGTQAGSSAVGLEISAANCAVRGISIGNFSDSGVRITGSAATGNTITGCYIGTDATGTAANAHGSAGVEIVNGAKNNIIGGSTAVTRNLISGNSGSGVLIDNASGNTIAGNYIGLSASGTQMLANVGNGVQIINGALGNIIHQGNVIAFNRGNGVHVEGNSRGNTIRGTAIYANAGIGINLVGSRDLSNGVTPNDPGDGDGGPNDLQNYPIITSTSNTATSTSLSGTLNSQPNSAYIIEFFVNSTSDPSGFGQGQRSIGSVNVSTNSQGNATFSFTYNRSGQFFSATATNVSTGDTSEFSQIPIAIINFSPASGARGTQVAITGSGFTTDTTVKFGNVQATEVNILSDSQLTARVPQGATSGKITVANSLGSATSTRSFEVSGGGTSPIARPANDMFAAARLVAGISGQVTGTNVNATKEPGEPSHALDEDDTPNPGGSSVWYRWIAPGRGTALFDTQGSGFDTILGVYTGTGVNRLTPVANNDDNEETDSATSKVRFETKSGTVYYIAVDGYEEGGLTAQGNLILNWSFSTGRPANDNLTGAEVISGNSGQVTGLNINATREDNEPDHAEEPARASVWYKWVAPDTGSATFSTRGSNFDTLLAIYKLSELRPNAAHNNLLEVASNDDDGALLTSSATFLVTQGTTYYIAVDGYEDSEGRVVLDWLLTTSSGTPVRWINPSGGQWSRAANWSPARVPGPTDQAVIDLPGTYTITLNVDATIAGLTLGTGNSTQTLAIATRTLTLNGISKLRTRSVLNLSGGALIGQGNLAVEGVLNWTGGRLGGLGSTLVAANGGVNIIDAPGTIITNKFLSQKTFINEGSVRWSGRTRLIGGNGANLRNSGLVDARSDATFGWDGVGDKPTFTNLPGGRFIKSVGAAREIDDTVTAPATVLDGVALFNSGTVSIGQGVLRLKGGGQSYGVFDIPHGSQLQFTSDYFFAKDSSRITGEGHICILGESVAVNNNVDTQTFSICEGVLEGNSVLQARKSFNWEGGAMAGKGQTNVLNGARLSIFGSEDKSLIGRTFNNSGIGNWTGDGQFVAEQGAIFNNNGTLNTESGPQGITFDEGEGDAPTFNNSGTINPGNGEEQEEHQHSIGRARGNKPRATAVAPTGIFNIYGSYNQSASGILNLDIAGTTPGTSYDQVNINGQAKLGGTLNVQLQNGFVPKTGDVFEIVRYEGRQGAFNVQIQNLPAGVRLQTEYRDNGTSKALVLKVVTGTFSISGRVVDSAGAGVAGVTITRTGAANANSPAAVVTDTEGNYRLPNVLPGSYTIRAALNGVTLSPGARSVTLNNADLNNINFIAQFSISGRVTNSAGNGLAGVTIARSRTQGGTVTQRTQTDSNGNYTLAGVPEGDNILTASLQGYGFIPPTVSLNIQSEQGSAANINFTGFRGPYISGRVVESTTTVVDGRPTTVGMSNVIVKRVDNQGRAATVTTNTNGYYFFEATPPGNYVVGPVLSGWVFNFRSVTVSNTLNAPGVNFSGTRLNVNTDGEGADARSSLKISTATARVVSQSVTLQFSGALDVNHAADAEHYKVTINGRAVAVESVAYRSSNYHVVLGLPAGSLRNGDKMTVTWTRLRDAGGRVLNGQIGPLAVK